MPNSESKPDSALSTDASKKKKGKRPPKPKFKGKTDGMNGFVFETCKESKDPTGFVKSLEALEQFANKTHKMDLSPVFQQPKGSIPVIPRPTPPGNTTDA